MKVLKVFAIILLAAVIGISSFLFILLAQCGALGQGANAIAIKFVSLYLMIIAPSFWALVALVRQLRGKTPHETVTTGNASTASINCIRIALLIMIGLLLLSFLSSSMMQSDFPKLFYISCVTTVLYGLPYFIVFTRLNNNVDATSLLFIFAYCAVNALRSIIFWSSNFQLIRLNSLSLAWSVGYLVVDLVIFYQIAKHWHHLRNEEAFWQRLVACSVAAVVYIGAIHYGSRYLNTHG